MKSHCCRQRSCLRVKHAHNFSRSSQNEFPYRVHALLVGNRILHGNGFDVELTTPGIELVFDRLCLQTQRGFSTCPAATSTARLIHNMAHAVEAMLESLLSKWKYCYR